MLAPDAPTLLGLIREIAPALAAGNTVVAVISRVSPLPLPGPRRGRGRLGRPGRRAEPAVRAASTSCWRRCAATATSTRSSTRPATPRWRAPIDELAAETVKRVSRPTPDTDSLSRLEALIELKTAWHPIGVLSRVSRACAGTLTPVPGLRVRVVPADALAEGVAQIEREAGVPEAFPADVLAEAQAAAARTFESRAGRRSPSSRSTRRARATSTRRCTSSGAATATACRYAIADPGVFIAPGGPLDRDTHARGGDRLRARREGRRCTRRCSRRARRSLLPGRVAAGGAVDVRARRARRRSGHRRRAACSLRSVAQHTYEDVPRRARAAAAARWASGGSRSSASAAACSSPCPSRRSSCEDGGWTVRYRVPTRSRTTTRRSRC